MSITMDGQLNIKTKDKKETQIELINEDDLARKAIAEEQIRRGEIRIDMNFTPLMAHRYLQNQINEMARAFKIEKSLNATFRNEISVLQTFKLNCDNMFNGLDDSIKQNSESIE